MTFLSHRAWSLNKFQGYSIYSRVDRKLNNLIIIEITAVAYKFRNCITNISEYNNIFKLIIRLNVHDCNEVLVNCIRVTKLEWPSIHILWLPPLKCTWMIGLPHVQRHRAQTTLSNRACCSRACLKSNQLHGTPCVSEPHFNLENSGFFCLKYFKPSMTLITMLVILVLKTSRNYCSHSNECLRI